MTEDVTLDTSGAVEIPKAGGQVRRGWLWPDLDPFTQGCIEALFASARVPDRANLKHHGLYMHDGHGSVRAVGFSDLAPETLARIIADCAEEVSRWATPSLATRHNGGEFWTARQTGTFAGERAHLRPLTPYLSDDGKVYLREAGQ